MSNSSHFSLIKSYFEGHIAHLQDLTSQYEPTERFNKHLKFSFKVCNELTKEAPSIMRLLIEYLESESRAIGWSFPETKIEEEFEKSFLNFRDTIKQLVKEMTVNERLHYFGYMSDYDFAKRSEKERIEYKLFISW